MVRVGRGKDGKKVAVKTYMKGVLNGDRHSNLQQEVKVLEAIDHPCVLNFHQCIETEDSYNLVT